MCSIFLDLVTQYIFIHIIFCYYYIVVLYNNTSGLSLCQGHTHAGIEICSFDYTLLEKLTAEWLLGELHNLEEELYRIRRKPGELQQRDSEDCYHRDTQRAAQRITNNTS